MDWPVYLESKSQPSVSLAEVSREFRLSTHASLSVYQLVSLKIQTDKTIGDALEEGSWHF